MMPHSKRHASRWDRDFAGDVEEAVDQRDGLRAALVVEGGRREQAAAGEHVAQLEFRGRAECGHAFRCPGPLWARP
ncbi:MAG: hypothetical protein H7066_21215 [Cytophagaceae bacterium]|nr:hypothetical protein [Gemmatimonadaceae bacterium]